MKNIAAAIQMASGPNVQGNLGEAARLINDAVRRGAKLVVLPENFAHMGMHESDKLDIAEQPGQGPIQDFLVQQAKKYNICLVGGTIPMHSEEHERVYAASLVFDENGELLARYDKYHLFDVEITKSNESYFESETIKPGNQLAWFNSPVGRVGIAVCYDVRFPELFRSLMDDDIELFVIPSAFTATTGAAHWETLIRARAIENLCYVVAANQGGYHVNERETHGESMIVDPWGVILDRLERGSGCVVAEIDLAKIKSLRNSFPVLNHRRLKCEIKNDG